MKLTRGNIIFGDGDKHAIITLKRSKTDIKHKGVKIIIAATNSLTCPIKALRMLFEQDPQPQTKPLFRL